MKGGYSRVTHLNRCTYSDGEESNSLVDSAEGRYIDSLATDSTLRANTSGIFTRASVYDSIDENLHVAAFVSYFPRVNKTRNSNLNRVLVCKEVNDFEGVGDDADSHKLLAVVATFHHQAKEASI